MYKAVGRADESRVIVDEMLRSPGIPPFFMALLYLTIDDLDQVFASLDRGLRERADLMHTLRTNPFLVSLWQDPRFAALFVEWRARRADLN